MSTSTITSLLREFDEIGQVTTDLIGLEQIAQIKALKEHVESLEKELEEKNEQIRFLSSRQPPPNQPVSGIVSPIMDDLTELLDEPQRARLRTIQAIGDPQTMNDALLNFLVSLYENSRDSEARLAAMLRGYVAFIETLQSDPANASFAALDAPLTPRAKRVISQQFEATTKLLAEVKGEYDPIIPSVGECEAPIQTDNLKRLLEGEHVSYHELEAMIWQESALIFALQRRLHEGSEVTRRKIRREMEAEIRQDLEDQIRLSIESDVRKDVEKEIRSQIRSEIEEEVKTEVETDVYESVERSVRSKLQKELTPKVTRRSSASSHTR